MSLDQVLGDAARGLTAELSPPEVDLGAVHRGARARRRRAQAAVAAAVTLAVVTTGAFLVDGRPDSSPQPVLPVPTPTSTPAPTPTDDVEPTWSPEVVSVRDVVLDQRARASATGIAAGDPDTRLAIWAADGRTGVAATTDAYRSTTYVPVPRLQVDAYQVLSPRDDLFLLSHVNHTDEWLVGADGVVRRVDRVRGEVAARDERLWFQCAVGGGWRSTWCALDPESGTAYVWPDAWDGSAVPPGRGVTPWGANPEPRSVGGTGRLEVWWGSGGEREVRTLATAQFGDYVLDCPPDVMALWSVAAPGAGVDIHTSSDGGDSWQTTSYAAPTADQWWKVRCAPDGSFLAVDSERGTTVWRASPSDDAFRQVFSAPGSPSSIGIADVRTVGGRVLASGEGVAAISDDAGATWTRLEDWR
ncbi:hypothetical protein GCM10011376_27210 [Nocardioides flavus (ex Wang et al. 2016)]|uniref:Exo-alpha-sialidase n=1 Tax=Nocardioides flavus (ex Wang et al. 2016) TaxID=2058780 RepID=A0ABQ3HLK6_9ACTN|nr:hypothetical protein [Nocardioides flavus (ex Wang et al. 2016)]GHE18111.1 hypothetical protein GCM10011376_27210 [Nocardioides flavus (ex Wang et al. 2016)]